MPNTVKQKAVLAVLVNSQCQVLPTSLGGTKWLHSIRTTFAHQECIPEATNSASPAPTNLFISEPFKNT